MKRIRHVCQAGTAAERVHALTGGDVLAIADDASVGPLQDIDLLDPRLRAAFWEAVFDGDPDMAGMDWYRELGEIRFQLSTLLREADEIVIWAGSSSDRAAPSSTDPRMASGDQYPRIRSAARRV